MLEDQPENTDIAKHLVDLIINQDHVALKWIQFLITIEAGLVVALGFLLKPGSETYASQSYLSVTAYMIPVIGIVIAATLTCIIVKERQWQAWYVTRVNNLEGYSGKIFPADKSSITTPYGPISYILIGLFLLIGVIWVSIMFMLTR